MTSREKLSFQKGKKLKSIGMRSYVKCKIYLTSFMFEIGNFKIEKTDENRKKR